MRIKRLKTKIFLSVLGLFIIWMVVLSFQTFEYPDEEEIDKRLNYLERAIDQRLTPDSEIALLGMESSKEFMLFSYAYSTYALTNLAVRDSAYKKRAEKIIRESINKTLDYRVSISYGIDRNMPNMDSIPDYSILYLGHLNLMMGCYRLLSNDSTFNRLNDKISESLFKRYGEKEFYVPRVLSFGYMDTR